MRERYWSVFNQMKFNFFYFDKYKTIRDKQVMIMKSFLLVMACGGVASLPFWDNMPIAWPIMLVIVQSVGAIQDYLPFTKEADGLAYFVPELGALMVDVAYGWDMINCTNEQAIAEKIRELETRYVILHDKYLHGLTLKTNSKCNKYADLEQKKFFAFYEKETTERMSII